MYVVIVTEKESRAFDVRCVVDSIDQGKGVITAERARTSETDVSWIDEFGGAIARSGVLEYEIRPVTRRR